MKGLRLGRPTARRGPTAQPATTRWLLASAFVQLLPKPEWRGHQYLECSRIAQGQTLSSVRPRLTPHFDCDSMGWRTMGICNQETPAVLALGQSLDSRASD